MIIPEPELKTKLPQPTAKSHWELLLLLPVAIWGVAVTSGQLGSQYLISGMFTTIPSAVFALFPIIQGILLLIVLLPLAKFVKRPAFRAVSQTWLLAAVLGIGLTLTRFTGFSAAPIHALIHILLGGVYTILILAFTRKRQKPHLQAQPARFSPSLANLILQAILLATLFAYPWLAWGALGSVLETIGQILVALVLGSAAAVTFDAYLSIPLRREIQGELLLYIVEGFSISIALFIFLAGTGFPFGAMQMLLVLCVSALGWAVSTLTSAAALQHRSPRLPVTLLIGLSLAAPLTLIDPDELYLVITMSSGEVLSWAFFAALASAIIAGLAGFGILLAKIWRTIRPAQQPEKKEPRPVSPLSTILLAGAVLATSLVGAAIYFFVGQPGFYGEGMFVILKEQADLSSAASIPDGLVRRQYVYDTLVSHANTTQADLRQGFDQFGLEYTSYYLVNAIQIKGNVLIRLWLLTRPEVDRVLDNPWLRPLPVIPPEGTGHPASAQDIPWNITMIEAQRVWQELGITGEGIVVGQSDSGVQGTHPQLADSYRGRDGHNDYNWLDPWYHTTQPTDIGGHGTHTLGTILGETTGVAPGATWFGCVNLARNLGNPALYLDCMQFMLAPFPQNGDPLRDGDPSRGAHVINNSWGCPEIEGCDATSLYYGVRNLRLAGIFVVASAGNDGPACNSLNTPPAIYDEAFSVGAIDSTGQIAFFSSIGPVTSDGSQRVKPDIMAPGVDVFSSMPGNTYAANSGTSMAGPHVVGLVALMWSANPALIGNMDVTEQIIIETADPYTGSMPACPGASGTPSTVVGYGVINAYNAVKAALDWR